MSLENHPNFHACNFITKIIEAYYESLRGGASKDNAPLPHEGFEKFVNEVEERVNAYIKTGKKKEREASEW